MGQRTELTAPVRGLRRLPQAVLDAAMRSRAIDGLAGRVLVVAPHPDDETLGCGGTILRTTDAGGTVDIAFATDGSRSHSRFMDTEELAALRRTEAVAAAAVLGVGPGRLHFLGLADGGLADHHDAAAAALTALVTDLRPDHVLVPSRHDSQQDHLAARHAAVAALRRSGREAEILEFPIWFWHHWPWIPVPLTADRALRRAVRTSARRRLGLQALTEFGCAVDVGDVLDRKRAALACHRTQTTHYAGDPEWPILDDVAGGLFLDRFFQRYELFRRCRVGTDGHGTYQGPSSWPREGPRDGRPDGAALPSGDSSPAVLVRDDFALDVPPGLVVGSTEGSVRRLGVDAEDRISVEGGALRFEPMEQPGWGRQGIAYGPLEARPGLTVAFFVLNGHNCSQTEHGRGPELAGPARWLRAARVRLRRLLRRLSRGGPGQGARPGHRSEGAFGADHPTPIPPRKVAAHRSRVEVRDNLTAGWLTMPDADPPDGVRFVVHATRTVNGELRVGGRQLMRLFDGLQNLPVYYVVTLRDDGAVFYVASTPGASGPGPYPQLRPVAVTTELMAGTVFAGMQQSILGEVGYRAATRVYGVRVASIPAWGHRSGTAIVADRSPAPGRRAEVGGRWEQQADGSLRTHLDEPPGLVSLRLEITGGEPAFRLRWRAEGSGRGLELSLAAPGATLQLHDSGEVVTLARGGGGRFARASTHALQVLDDGARISLQLDGELLFDRFIDEDRLARGTGLAVAGDNVVVAHLEAHPRLVDLPAELDMGAPWDPAGARVVVADELAGGSGELDGPWRRSYGAGRIDRTGAGQARVRADRDRPNPGRTLYTVEWPEPGFVDIEVEITPPGDRRGQGHACRGGLCLWQDEDNHLVVNLWQVDRFPGSSVSSFLRYDGHEDFFDPVWSNVGRAVEPGQPVRLRVVSDGAQYIAHLQGRPVLYRAFSDIYPEACRFEIRRVGLAANWEWGDDTGTTFRDFRARGS